MNELSQSHQAQSCESGSCQISEQTASTQVIRPHWKLNDDGKTATLQIALPGVQKDSLELSAKERLVTLQAKRQSTGSGPQELQYELKLRLSPDLDANASSASLKNGVLKLLFPRREEAKPRSIPVSE